MEEKNKNIEERKRVLLEELVTLYNCDIENKNLEIDNNQIETKRETNVKDYFEGFYREFDIYREEQTKNIPLMIRLYQDFIEEKYQPSKRYKLVLKIRNEINADMEKIFTEEQQELMNQFKDCDNILIDDMVQEAFVYGYAMCNQLQEETTKKYPMENN